MTTALRYWSTSDNSNLEYLFTEYQFSPFGTDWYGNPAPARFEYFLALSANYLILAGRGAAPAHLGAPATVGEFREGLWNFDVIELFLRDDANHARYQEFNLSPDGAWWSQGFLHTRTPDIKGFRKPSGATVYSNMDAQGWRTALRIPRSDLSITFHGRRSFGNICGIFGKSPQQFFTVAPLSSTDPDFHRPEEFIPLSN